MYSSNPMIFPSIRSSVFSKSQIWIRVLFCRKRKMRLLRGGEVNAAVSGEPR